VRRFNIDAHSDRAAGDRAMWAIIVLLTHRWWLLYSAAANPLYRNSGGAVGGHPLKHRIILGFGLVVIYRRPTLNIRGVGAGYAG
jgi:hypothetical protein